MIQLIVDISALDLFIGFTFTDKSLTDLENLLWPKNFEKMLK